MAMRGSRSRRAGGLALAGALAALLPTAPAHGWVEQAGYDVPGGGVAACLRAGAPDELALLGRLGRTTAATDLLRIPAAPDRAPVRKASTTLGWPSGCAELASAPGTPTLLAGPVFVRAPRRWLAGLRVARPGERPVRIPRPAGTSVSGVAVAAAPGGAAALAWLESYRGRDGTWREFPRVMVALRKPSATAFGRPRLVARNASGWNVAPVVGVDARGRATVAWIGSGGPADRDGNTPADVIRLASSRADGRFSTPRTLDDTWSRALALAVAPNGRTLLATGAGDGQTAWERTPGRRRFARMPLDGGTPEDLAVTVRDDGAAAIVYDNLPSIHALLRTRAGEPFRHVPVRSLDDPDGSGTGVQLFDSGPRRPVPPGDETGAGVHVRFGRGGTVVASWVDGVDGERPARAHAARGTLAHGFEPAAALGSACRTVDATTPVELPDGGLGVAWTDDADVTTFADNEYRHGSGRLHVARPGTPPPAPAPAPLGLSAQVLPGPNGPGAVRTGEPLRLRVRCAGGPCDVRAFAEAQYVKEAAIDPRFVLDEGPLPFAVAAHVPAGEERTLELQPLAGYGFAAPGAAATPPIRLIACLPPSGPVAEQVTLSPQLTGVPLRARPRLLDVRAVRRGDVVVVSWRTAEPAVETSFNPIGFGRDGGVAARGREIPGDGRTEFSARLLDPRRRVSRVRLVATDAERGAGAAIETVRLR